jgi:branched-subunit amino acid aminotransferase/4-amino-4-deoxychorismate lyase
LEEIKLAKEVFITSSTKRIVPISQLDETIYPPYTPNSVTWKLFELLCEHERQYIHAEKD